MSSVLMGHAVMDDRLCIRGGMLGGVAWCQRCISFERVGPIFLLVLS
jgi:hypothetical protein